MTQKNIAKLANVSLSTVSKALSGSKEISTELTDKIIKIAIENGYFKEKGQRKLEYSKHKSVLIAVVCPEISGVWYSTIITNLKNEVELLGGQVSVYIYDFDLEKRNRILQMLVLRNDADGIFMISSEGLSFKPNIPIICFGNSDELNDYDTVYSDIDRIYNDIVKYLKDLKHTKIGFVGESNTMQKYNAYIKAMKNNGLEADKNYIYIINKRFEDIGYDAANIIAENGSYPSAIITAYDEIALALIHSLTSKGISVPHNISVVGINDIPSAGYAKIPLTTVSLFNRNDYKDCVSVLYNKILKNDNKIHHILSDYKLIIRKSTEEYNG